MRAFWPGCDRGIGRRRGRRRDRKPQRQHRIAKLLGAARGRRARPHLVEPARRGRRGGHPGDGVARPRGARGRQGPCPRRRDRLRAAELPVAPGGARGPPPAGARRVGRGGRALGQPGGAPDPSGFGPCRRLGSRPQRVPRRVSGPWPATTPSSWSPPRSWRARCGRPSGRGGGSRIPGASRRGTGRSSATESESRLAQGVDHEATSRAGLQRRPGHLRGGPLAAGGAWASR